MLLGAFQIPTAYGKECSFFQKRKGELGENREGTWGDREGGLAPRQHITIFLEDDTKGAASWRLWGLWAQVGCFRPGRLHTTHAPTPVRTAMMVTSGGLLHCQGSDENVN